MRYLLKEYGSWSVMILSFLIGILISWTFNLSSFLSLLSVSMFINSKQAFTVWIRQKKPNAVYIFLGQVIIGSLFIILVFSSETLRLIPFAIIPLSYVASLYLLGEHAVLTELLGFATLTMAAPLARFSASGLIDIPLYVATAIFFMAGVLKVRIQLRKRLIDRFIMISYIVISIIVYSLIKIPVILLLPLMDNLIFALTLYRVRLATTGWIEVAKSVTFVVLSIFFYQ